MPLYHVVKYKVENGVQWLVEPFKGNTCLDKHGRPDKGTTHFIIRAKNETVAEEKVLAQSLGTDPGGKPVSKQTYSRHNKWSWNRTIKRKSK